MARTWRTGHHLSSRRGGEGRVREILVVSRWNVPDPPQGSVISFWYPSLAVNFLRSIYHIIIYWRRLIPPWKLWSPPQVRNNDWSSRESEETSFTSKVLRPGWFLTDTDIRPFQDFPYTLYHRTYSIVSPKSKPVTDRRIAIEKNQLTEKLICPRSLIV